MSWCSLVISVVFLSLDSVTSNTMWQRHQQELQHHFEHLTYIAQFPCNKPQSRVVSVHNLLSEYQTRGKTYFPDSTVLYRCDFSSGCCDPGYDCVPVTNSPVTLPFKVTYLEDMGTFKRGQWEMVYETLDNHAECGCVPSRPVLPSLVKSPPKVKPPPPYTTGELTSAQSPARPVNQQPFGPVYQQPSGPVYQQPSGPVYQQPSGPAYQQPSRPNIPQPSRPNNQKPLGPVYQQPSNTGYQQPSRPNYQQPSRPVNQQPGPVYQQPGQAFVPRPDNQLQSVTSPKPEDPTTADSVCAPDEEEPQDPLSSSFGTGQQPVPSIYQQPSQPFVPRPDSQLQSVAPPNSEDPTTADSVCAPDEEEPEDPLTSSIGTGQQPVRPINQQPSQPFVPRPDSQLQSVAPPNSEDPTTADSVCAPDEEEPQNPLNPIIVPPYPEGQQQPLLMPDQSFSNELQKVPPKPEEAEATTADSVCAPDEEDEPFIEKTDFQ